VTLLLTRSDLARLLDPRAVIAAVERAFGEYSAGRTETPVRSHLGVPDPPGVLLVMPCALHESRALGTKIVSVYRQNPSRGLPTICSVYALSDYETGRPLAVLDGAYLTGLRTACASAVATRYLAQPDARVLGIFGTGLQAEFHALVIPLVRPIERILVWGTSPEKMAAFAARLGNRCSAPIEPGASPEQVAASADVIVTATTSPTPVFPGRAVRPGAHVNAVGAFTPTTRELDSDLVARARLVADTYAGVWAEAGDILIPLNEGRITRDAVVAELGEIVLGRKPGRLAPEEITIFESVGAAFEDAATASLAYRRALEQDTGVAIDLDR
jgi:ornithine cyclodeaminase/alanine dehydrogenase